MRLITSRFLMAFAALAFWGASMAPALAQGTHNITLQEADIRAFIDDVSMVTGRTFLVDPRVQGKVTISTEQTLSTQEVFEVFKEVLRVHGYTAIPTSTGEYRITLIQGAAQDAPFVNNFGLSGQFATTVIRLNFADAAEAAKLIKPVMHPQGLLTANPGGDIIVVSDFPENLRKARAIAESIDTDGSVMETIRLTSLSAGDAEDALRNLQGQRPTVTVVSIPQRNAIVLQGPREDIDKLRSIVSQLDYEGVDARGPVIVLPLRHANGADMIEMLTSILPAYERDGEPTPTVAHDPGSNSLIISASSETQGALEGVIRQLDQRRPQVLVEAIIVEVSDDAARELGVQFAIAGDGSDTPLIATNYSRAAPDLLSITGAVAGSSAGLSTTTIDSLESAAVASLLGLSGGTVGFSANGSDTLFNVIINAVQDDANSNILSTPFVTTLDNVPASFLVGQEIPITTGESLGSANINPFRTFERQDIGIKLEVLPQISEGDVIRLEIKQEVSSLAGAISTLSSDFIINTREIETTVLASDGEVIVLGGLIEDDEEVNVSKVPVLGDAPVIGPLFRSEGKSQVRTNLMVFLRPTIIRNSEDAIPLTQRRIDYMRQQEMIQSGRTTSKLDGTLDGQ